MRTVTAGRFLAGWFFLALSSPAVCADFSITGSSSGNVASLTLTANVQVAPGDAGAQGVVYVAATVAGSWFFRSAAGGWQAWPGGALPEPYYTGMLGSHTVSIVESADLLGYAGTEVYVGYGRSQEDMLTNAKFAKVYRVPSSLAVGGAAFRFLGGFVPGWHWGNETWSRAVDDDLIGSARANGITVLHAMLPQIESSLGVYNEAELAKLDYFLDSANRNNVYVIPAFAHGLDIATQSYNPYYHPQGIEGLVTDPQLGAAFRNRIERLLMRRNSVNQRLYRDDPTILGWIIIDEPISAPWNYPQGAPNVSAASLNSWFNGIAAFIKSLDPNHLVTVFTTAAINTLGADWVQALDFPGLDFFYAEDADLLILSQAPETAEVTYPLKLMTLNKPLVTMLSFTSGALDQQRICSDYAWQAQTLGSASLRYFGTGASGVTMFHWGSDRYLFVPSFDRCYTYTASNQTVAQEFRGVAQSVNPLADPRPPLGFVMVR